jgi:arylsulfatase A-like enzyme
MHLDMKLFDPNHGWIAHHLKDRIESEDLLLVVTSDHGEAFWEHGILGTLAHQRLLHWQSTDHRSWLTVRPIRRFLWTWLSLWLVA